MTLTWLTWFNYETKRFVAVFVQENEQVKGLLTSLFP